MKPTAFIAAAALTSAAIAPAPASAQQRSYTTIQGVTVTPLSNGVQIRINADGLLQLNNPDASGRIMHLTFPDARNGTGKTFINVNRYPVSYIQLSTAPGAATHGGVGMVVTINNFIDTTASVSATPDGQGVLLTVRSDRTISGGRAGGGGARQGGDAAAGAGAPGGTGADTSTLVEFAGGLLTLRAVRADIHGLMNVIGRKTGLSIGVDDAVERRVSLNLRGVPPDVVLQTIATAYGLSLARVDDVYMVSEGEPRDLATYRLSGTASYRMQNLQAGTASGLLPNFLFSYVRVNPEQNAVVVTAPAQMLDKIGRDLTTVDVIPPQILIEAIAVEFTNTDDRDFGILLNNQRSTSIATVDTNSGVITYNSIGKLPTTFDLSLRALELTGKARVRARPQMAVVNGKSADIFIGAQRFILTQFNSFGQTQTRIQPVDVGVKLAVTPLTGGNGEIQTRIAPEVSNITELDLQTGLPVLSTRRADTTVRVKDGETIAIGGLTLDQNQVANRKIPLFGDLPLIGPLFRSRKSNTVRTELVVFVTPHIIGGTTGQTAGTGRTDTTDNPSGAAAASAASRQADGASSTPGATGTPSPSVSPTTGTR
jgi:type IV pilus assembly protein PilQ